MHSPPSLRSNIQELFSSSRCYSRCLQNLKTNYVIWFCHFFSRNYVDHQLIKQLKPYAEIKIRFIKFCKKNKYKSLQFQFRNVEKWNFEDENISLASKLHCSIKKKMICSFSQFHGKWDAIWCIFSWSDV